MKATDSPIIIEHQYKTTAKQVWEALTSIEKMHQWYFEDLPAFEPVVDFETSFVVHNEGRTFTHMFKVLSVVPQKEITYSWQFKEYDGISSTKFLIENETEETVTLKLVIEILEDSPEGIPEFKIESSLAGWDFFLNQRLRRFLEGII